MMNPLIRTCPICGFTFNLYDPKTRKKISVCPMCGYKFVESDILPNKPKKFDKKFF